MNEAILATDLEDNSNYIWFAKTTSNSSTWGFDRFRLYYPNWGTRIGLYSMEDFNANAYQKANGQWVLDVAPTYGSKVFSTTNGFEHDFSFDLSFNTSNAQIAIAIQSIPLGSEFQQVYSYPTGYGATYNKDADIVQWDFSVVNTGVNVGASATSMFFENQPLDALFWFDTTRTPKIFAKTLRFQNCLLIDVMLDKIINWTDAGGVTNGNLNYSGNPQAPTNASRAAYDNLINKGWTITGTAPPTS
jgi:hypothetical protein